MNRRQMFYWQADRPFDEAQTKQIFLDRHQNFDLNLAKQAIELGLNQKIVKVDGMMKFGSVNVSVKAQVSDGCWVIFRAHPPQVKNGYFWAEAAAAQAAIKIGVPSYRTYLIDDTRQKFDFDYMLIECLPGKTMQALWPIKPALDSILIEQTGELLAKIHSIKTKQFGFFDNQLAKKKQLVGIHSQWSDHILAALDSNLDYLFKTKVISLKQVNQAKKVFSINQALMHLNQAFLIQNDLADWNLMVDKNKISGMIDWDECHSGDPVMDIACFSLFFPDVRVKHLIAGYKKVAELPENFDEKLHLYKLRYVLSKLVIRKKKLMFYQDKFYQDLLERGLQVLKEEFDYYGL